MIVYKIINSANNKLYVGRTVNSLGDRWTRHIYDAFVKQLDYPLYRAMRKYGIDSFKIKEIDQADSRQTLNKKEADWMIKLNSMTYQNGYNLRSEDTRLETAQETRIKISEALTGKKKTYRITQGELSRVARKNGLKAMENKEEWAVKNGSKPFKVYKAICVQYRKKGQPSIYKKGEYIGEWLIASDCAKELNVSRRHLGACLSRTRKQHKGYIFERCTNN